MYTFDVLSLHYSCYSICIFFPFLLKTSIVYMWVLVQYCFLVCYTEGGLSLRISLSAVMCHYYLSYKKKSHKIKIYSSQGLAKAGQQKSGLLGDDGSLYCTVEQEIHIMDAQPTNLKQDCEAATSIWTKLWGMIPAPCWIYAMKN